MIDIIQQLPDTVANQIAAGEVIQRPASAVKELLENAVDAGSKRIEVFVKDSGKTLIQISDDGSGMSPTDARMAFARHATSKIRNAEDLFSIRTMGFRGEALASIAAIAQVELKSRRHDDDIGNHIIIEGNEVKKQQPASTNCGTLISVKNLFYNVPARRNFLKSNTIEARHIIDEFERVAYAHPDISFSLNQNGVEIFNLPASNFRQRIVNINGHQYNERLVPVSEQTTMLNIKGFVGKPEFSRKTRGEQFFFVNKRFIKDGYLHHAVTNAFEELLSKENYPSYWLFIDIDPSRIDVNIHPTKTEIKFEDERSVYAIVRASVKRALGQYSVTPSLDFDKEKSFELPHSMRNQPVIQPGITVNTEYNPFKNSNVINNSGWQKFYDDVNISATKIEKDYTEILSPEEETKNYAGIFQSGQFIICKMNDGLMIVNIAAARERIFYHQFLLQLSSSSGISQQDLFPQSFSFSPSDFQILLDIKEEIRAIGFDMEEFGLNTIVLHGIPPDVEKGKEKEILDSLLEQFKNNSNTLSAGVKENLARSMAKSLSAIPSHSLSEKEMESLITQIRSTEKGHLSIDGKPTFIIIKHSELAEKFGVKY